MSTAFRNNLRLFSFTLCYLHRPLGGPPLRDEHGVPPAFTTTTQRATQKYCECHNKWAGSAEKFSLLSTTSRAKTPQQVKTEDWREGIKDLIFCTSVSRPWTNHSFSGTQSPNLQNTACLTSYQGKLRH